MGKLVRFLIYPYILISFARDKYENRKHVHATDRNFTKLSKFWIEREGLPEVSLVENNGFTQKELNEIQNLIEQYLPVIEKQLNAFFEGKQVKIITL